MSSTSEKRADARRNAAAILEAATACLAQDPHASVQDIAKAAGVGRVTLYGHFESRTALVAAVVDQAMTQTETELRGLDLSGDATQALARLLDATWRLTSRYGALVVAAEQALPAEALHDAHSDPVHRVEELLVRGRDEGCFRADQPVAWQVTVLQGILHAAFGAVHRGETTAQEAPRLVRESALATLALPVGSAASVPGKSVS